jgi:hypothetical protein
MAMSLDSLTQGELEIAIDRAVRTTIPAFVGHFRSNGIQKRLSIKEESDYLVGLAHGALTALCMPEFARIHHREMNSSEFNEMMEIIYCRTNEFRDSIVRMG